MRPIAAGGISTSKMHGIMEPKYYWEAENDFTELGPHFYAPTILADVTDKIATIMREETFGPVLPCLCRSMMSDE